MTSRHLRAFIAFAGGKALALPLTLLTTILVGRILGPGGLGRWTLVFAAGTLLHTVFVNWTHASTVRYGREEWEQTGGLNRTLGARLPLLVVAIALAALLVCVSPAHWMQRWFAMDAGDWWMVALVSVSTWLTAEAQATLQVTDRFGWQAVLAPLIGASSVVALLALFWTGLRSLAWMVAAFSALQIAGWGGVWLGALARSQTRLSRLVFQDVRRHLRFDIPTMPTFALGYVSNWGDHLLLSRFATVAEVGFFSISYQLMLAMLAANGVLTAMLLPRLVAQEVAAPGFMRTYVRSEVPTLYALWMIGTVWAVALLPAAVQAATGVAFSQTSAVLLVLLVAIPSSVITSLYTVLFNLQERTGRLVLYSLVMMSTNLSFSLVLIPRYGSAGAAAGTVVSYAVGQACYLWDQHRVLAVPARRAWLLWSAGVVVGVAQLAAGPGIGLRLTWALAATAALVVLVRAVGAIDASLVERMLGTGLRPLAGTITRVLIART